MKRPGLFLLSPHRPQKIDNLLQIVRECLDKGKYRDTTHAILRKQQRQITLPEIIHVLKNGRHEKAKDQFEERFNAWNYSIRGKTVDEDDLRVIVSFEEEKCLVLITAMYLQGRK